MTVSSIFLLSLLFLLLQPWSTIVTTAENDVYNQVNCGQGICKPSNTTTSPYECECSHGWKQLANTSNQYLKFLPCVIPNCTLDYSCSKAQPPVQQKENRVNGSLFDVCQWIDCGGGTCKSTSFFTHKCECSPGYNNLLNLTFSPCFRECSLGMDCKDLNLGFNGNPSSPPPPLSADRSNKAYNILEGRYDWLILLTYALLAI
ncbi:uncharacterized protein LOC143578144 [Bidens hawaiensis]|uniref:uncharacterized protein LOC143578144 n=1 Tax=Bidens hawaiensis TaxID=980011 RepID=UPI00404A6248